MSDLNAADPTTANYDAQQLVEEIATGDEATPKVDVDADYERSKEFDVAEIDKASGSAAGGPVKDSTGAPEDYLEMAKQVTPTDA